MKLLKGLFVCLAVLGLTLTVITGNVMAEDKKITMTGSTTVLPFAQKAAEAFMKKYPDVSISVAGTGSSDGVKSIIDGTADIGNASRDAKKKELKAAEAKGVTLKANVVGLDCVVPIVNPANPVADLKMDQLKAIYTGKVKSWKEVGGEDKPIVVVSRDSSSGTFEVWNHKVLNKERVRPDAQLQASNGAVAQAVAGNKYAIGYVGLGYLNDNLKLVTIDGVAGSAETAADGKYPVARPLNMYTNGEPKGVVKEFMDFAQGPEGKKLALEVGVIPVN